MVVVADVAVGARGERTGIGAGPSSPGPLGSTGCGKGQGVGAGDAYDVGTVWVEPVLDPGEPFRLKLRLQERSWTLGREGAVRYALAVMQAAHYADYDAATLRLLARTGVDAAEATRLLVEDLRPDRGELDHEALRPLDLDVAVGAGGAPVVLILLDGQILGEWDVADAVRHAETVLGAMFAAGLDAALYQAMVAQVGLDPGRARNVVRGIGPLRRL